MKAVLWTDTFQLCVISSGFLAIIIKVRALKDHKENNKEILKQTEGGSHFYV